MTLDQLTEVSALERADELLESAQDQTRGATRVLSIRQSIAKRIKELRDLNADTNTQGILHQSAATP